MLKLNHLRPPEQQLAYIDPFRAQLRGSQIEILSDLCSIYPKSLEKPVGKRKGQSELPPSGRSIANCEFNRLGASKRRPVELDFYFGKWLRVLEVAGDGQHLRKHRPELKYCPKKATHLQKARRLTRNSQYNDHY